MNLIIPSFRSRLSAKALLCALGGSFVQSRECAALPAIPAWLTKSRNHEKHEKHERRPTTAESVGASSQALDGPNLGRPRDHRNHDGVAAALPSSVASSNVLTMTRQVVVPPLEALLGS